MILEQQSMIWNKNCKNLTLKPDPSKHEQDAAQQGTGTPVQHCTGKLNPKNMLYSKVHQIQMNIL